jgi:hypothetical protein
MPRLRRYVSGSGFYLNGFLPGAGHCTWQIGDEGLAYLCKQGVRAHGDVVNIRDLKELIAKGRVWTTGEGGPPGTDAQGLTLPVELRPLAEGLGRWAAHGGLPELHRILYERHGDQRSRCFSPTFLNWLSRLDPALPLADMDAVSAPDFDDVAAPAIDRLKDPLHSFFARRGDTHVLWQLAKIVGQVARQKRGNPACPAIWVKSHPVLHRLFSLLGEQTPAQPDHPNKGTRPRQFQPGRPALPAPPTIAWMVDSQEVVALLPEQTLPGETVSVAWTISPGEAPPAQTWTQPDGLLVEEARSAALPPAVIYQIQTTLHTQSDPAGVSDRIAILLPERFSPCVLFAQDGTLISCEEGVALAAGEYLALAPKEEAGQLFKRRGVHEIEAFPGPPVGWWGWKACRVRLEAGADMAPYLVDSAGHAATWELEPPPKYEVVWRESLPVYLGQVPRLFVSDPAAFTGAVLEATREPAGAVDRLFAVGDVGGVPLRNEAGRYFLDLAASPNLAGWYGTLRLTCRPPDQPDAAPLTARFVYLPQMQVTYVRDPIHPDQARAALVGEPAQELGDLVADAGTVMRRDAAGLVLCASTPHLSPGVTARFSRSGAVLRLRIPATRVGRITEGQGFDGWRPPPLDDLDLGAAELGDRLRVELHEEPFLEEGQLMCRLVGGGMVAAGRSIYAANAVHFFEIDLHRWRDGFDLRAGGMVQVRGRDHWIDLARLKGHPEQETPPVIVDERGRLLDALEAALEAGDRNEVLRLAEQCREQATGPNATPVDQEMMALAAGRAFLVVADDVEELRRADACLTGLDDRSDLPEAYVLHQTIGLRIGARSGHTRSLSSDDIDRSRRYLADFPQKQVFLAECWYHLARGTGGPTHGAWQSCLERADAYLTTPGTPCPERREAEVLRALARLMLKMGPEAPSRASAKESKTADPWLAGLQLTANSIRVPQGRSALRTKVPALTDLVPAVLRPEDDALVRIAVAHAVGRAADETLLAFLAGWQRDQFFAIRLLRARQARLKGRADEAAVEYTHLLNETNVEGPDFLLDIVAAEMGADRRR